MSGATSININFHKQLDRTADGKTRVTVTNLVRILKHNPAYTGLWGWDEWRSQYVLTRVPPWGRLGREAPFTIVDDDILFLRSAVEQMEFVEMVSTTNMMWDAVHIVCRENSFDEVKVMLNATEWDGVPRLDTWAIDYLKAEDKPINRTICRKWLISAIARALRPGCQADYMLILEGPQSAGKSSALRILFGDLLLPRMPDPSHQYAGLTLQGKWCCESGELAHLSKADSASTKAFITETHDVYKVPHERATTRKPRRCVFAATTNHANYLRDSTGERRYWPLRTGVTGEFDLVGLAAVREQIFAEAKAAFDAGEIWHPTRQEEEAIREKHLTRAAEDPTYDNILEWTDGGARGGFTLTEALQQGLGLDKDKAFPRSVVIAVTDALKRIGYEKQRVQIDRKRAERYFIMAKMASQMAAECQK